jgi:hypothetical protein
MAELGHDPALVGSELAVVLVRASMKGRPLRGGDDIVLVLGDPRPEPR